MEIVLLHGALGCAKHWQSVANELSQFARVYTPDFPGHGNAQNNQVSDLDGLSDFLADYLNEINVLNPVVIGYSMGGYVALHAAIHNKIKPKAIVTIATKMQWNNEIAQEEASKLNWTVLESIKEKLHVEHGNHLDTLLPMTANILKSIGHNPIQNENIAELNMPLFMLRGDKDKMVTLEETQTTVNASNHAKMVLLEGQGHALERMDSVYLTQTLKQLLNL